MISICKDFGNEKKPQALWLQTAEKGFCLIYGEKNGKVVAKLVFLLKGLVVLSFFNVFFAYSFHILFVTVG